MKTRSIKLNEINPKTYIVDATNVRMGKLIAEVARILLGKNRVNSVKYIPVQDKVVIINADKFSVHPTKMDKKYYWHSGYMGGLHSETLSDLKDNKIEKLIRKSLTGMLPKNRFGRICMQNLTISTESSVDIPNAEIVTIK